MKTNIPVVYKPGDNPEKPIRTYCMMRKQNRYMQSVGFYHLWYENRSSKTPRAACGIDVSEYVCDDVLPMYRDVEVPLIITESMWTLFAIVPVCRTCARKVNEWVAKQGAT